MLWLIQESLFASVGHGCMFLYRNFLEGEPFSSGPPFHNCSFSREISWFNSSVNPKGS